MHSLIPSDQKTRYKTLRYRRHGQKGEKMTVTLKTDRAALDLNDTEALTAYIREHIRVRAAYVEDYETTSGICISVIVPPYMELYDADRNTVDVLIDIED